MQSDQDKFTLTTPPLATATRASPPEAPAPAYTPRTVWQTPHGLPPNFNRHRNPRPANAAKIVRRCLRLMDPLQRLSLAPAPHAHLTLS
jgi:hypothetical protein